MPKRKKHSSEAMSRQDLHLPPEIWTQILTKLPVKSILQCRRVCKTWYSLISCPNFISDHTAQTLNQSTGDRVLVHRSGNGVEKFTSHYNSFMESHEHHDVPELLLSPISIVEIVGSCDGLICFSRNHYRVIETDVTCSFHSFLIWNPSIRKLVELPLLYSPPVSHAVGYLFGFGFDSRSRDYKVVRVLFHKTHGSISSDVVVVARCDIFDLKKGVWRSSSSPMRPCCHSRPSVYLYGNLHWIGYNGTSTENALVSFNLSSEVLREIEMVPDALEVEGSYTEVISINGLLSLAVVKTRRQCIVRRHFMSVWSMKEYGVIESWTKLFNVVIELPCSTFILSLERFGENEVVLVERNEDGSTVLVLYNPKSKESKALLSDDLVFHRACFYKESLVLL